MAVEGPGGDSLAGGAASHVVDQAQWLLDFRNLFFGQSGYALVCLEIDHLKRLSLLGLKTDPRRSDLTGWKRVFAIGDKASLHGPEMVVAQHVAALVGAEEEVKHAPYGSNLTGGIKEVAGDL